MEIVKSILTRNPCYKAGRKIKVQGLMLHSVGCPQPSAEAFVRKWDRPDASRACVHAFIDGNTGKVYQTLPWDHRAWHGGGSSNNTHIGVEMCEPACIKYTKGASFSCGDKEAAMAVVRRTYQAAVELFAFLCREFGLNPLADGVIVSHKEGHTRGIASGHGDPDHLWKGLKSGYTMDRFRADVAAMVEAAGQERPAGSGNSEGTAGSVPSQKTAPDTASTANQEGSRKTTSDSDSVGSARSSEESRGLGTGGTIRAGALVEICSAGVYYSGKGMPSWVKGDRWQIKSVNGDRAVLGKNQAGTHEINSPVHVKYLTVVSGVSGNHSAAGAVTESVQRPNPKEALTISDRGTELVAKYEGCRLEAYKCPAGVWTIGYGHTAGVSQGDRLPSQEAARALLKEDLKKYGDHVNSCVKKGLITFPINQNQFDALTSFCYNCGNGNLQKLVSGRDAATIAEKLLLYNKGGGKVLPGLVRRRKEERALFLS